MFVAWDDGWNPAPVLAKSYDHGKSWTKPVNAGNSGGGWVDDPRLVISADGREVYIAWNSGDPWVVASHDGGTTWATPVKLTPPTSPPGVKVCLDT